MIQDVAHNLTSEAEDQLAALFAASFDNDPIVQSWNAGKDGKLRKLFRATLRVARQRGGCLVSEDYKALLLFTIETASHLQWLREVFLYWKVAGYTNICALLSIVRLAWKYSVRGKYGPYLYVRFVCTSPEMRNKGGAASLLDFAAHRAHSLGLHMAYETSGRLGFSQFPHAEKISFGADAVVIIRSSNLDKYVSSVR